MRQGFFARVVATAGEGVGLLGTEYTARGIRGLRVDLLRAGERFSLPGPS